MTPEYSINSFKALAYLKSSANDAEIYVEDSAIKNAYDILVKSLLPKGAKFTGVTSVGSRQKVLALCNADQKDSSRKRLYIIDGDLDVVAGLRAPRLKYLFRHKFYSIENMLISAEAVNQLGIRSIPNKSYNEVSVLLNWDHELKQFAKAFGPLFIMYSIAHFELKSARPVTVKTPVFSLCRKTPAGTFVPCRSRIFSKCKELMKLLCSQLKKENVRKIRRKHLLRIEKTGIGWENLVSGKDYLIRFLSHYLHVKTKFKCTDAQLACLLADFSTSSIDKKLKKNLTELFS